MEAVAAPNDTSEAVDDWVYACSTHTYGVCRRLPFSPFDCMLLTNRLTIELLFVRGKFLLRALLPTGEPFFMAPLGATRFRSCILRASWTAQMPAPWIFRHLTCWLCRVRVNWQSPRATLLAWRVSHSAEMRLAKCLTT